MPRERMLRPLLEGYPKPLAFPGARERIRRALDSDGARLAVLDDDPTGTQVVHDLPVLMRWEPADLEAALRSPARAFFLSTNSRAMSRQEACGLARALGVRLRRAAERTGRKLLLASRSDSTLRGHFPGEVDALTEEYECDGVVIAPAFLECGRYTIGNTQWVDVAGSLVPAHETEFARDPNFGYGSAHLPSWVQEKTGGRWTSGDVACIGLRDIREGGPGRVADRLSALSGGRPVVLSAACYEDLEVAVLGIVAAEAAGKRLVYRCAASFIQVRGGVGGSRMLRPASLGPGSGPGLVIVGSYTGLTTSQLAGLLAHAGTQGIEYRVDAAGERETERVADKANAVAMDGRTPVIYTSRKQVPVSGEAFLSLGKRVMDGLCGLFDRLCYAPAFVVAKGGITSHETAQRGLGVRRATVLGQAAPGVPVWRLGEESRYPGTWEAWKHSGKLLRCAWAEER